MGKILKPVSKISGIHGQPGEERVAQELAANLPDSYVILNSPRIHYKGETVDIDHIVIGPNGIFAIESKNMLGKITGGLMGNWIQEKRRAGKRLRIKIGNPSSQVNQYGKIIHTFLTANYAKSYQSKINIHLYPIVAFAFENIDLNKIDYTDHGMVGRVRILLAKELCQYILSIKEAEYTDEEIEKIADILIPADQRDQTGIFSSLVMSEVKEKFADRYELYEEIGRGNFAVVYRGFDFKLDREVAVKKLFTHKNDKVTIKRFFREAQINSKMQHDNIVSIYDFYEEEGECYLIMEFVEGETLADFVNSEALITNQILDIMENICSAVQHAHDLNIIHRDLKPANILINLDGKVKVTDFGIARLAEGPMLTQTHTSLGTPTIMAPEQVTGKDIDNRTDIFSLGVLMYFLYTKEYPFHGEHIGEVIHKIIYFEPEPPSTINSDISPLVEKIILKALEKNPEDRFQTVEEMRQAILYSINPDLAQDLSVGLALAGENSSALTKSLPKMFRSFFASEKRKFMAITMVTIIIFGSLFLTQAYMDSKNIVNKELSSRALGFNNENIGLLYSSPDQYEQVPVNLVGKVVQITDVSNNTMLFRLTIKPARNLKKDTIMVRASVTGGHFLFKKLQYVRVIGSISNESNPNNSAVAVPEPIVLANVLQPISDPWALVSPANSSQPINKAVNHDGQIVTLKKIEFANDETRLFVNVKNSKNNKIAKFNLQEPKASQGSSQFKEIKNRYETDMPSSFSLNPGNEMEEVIVLEPLNPNFKNANISLGTNNPYIFNLSWK